MACCPSIWWCTADGPEEVVPDSGGVYTRPSGAIGHPFRSLSDAFDTCPPPLPAVGAGCVDRTCDSPYPNEYMRFDIEVLTGCAAGFFITGGILTPTRAFFGSELCVTGYAGSFEIRPPYANSGCVWVLTVEISPGNCIFPFPPVNVGAAGLNFGYQFPIFVSPSCQCSGTVADSCSTVNGEVAQCTIANCADGRFASQAFTFSQASNSGRFRIYRNDVTPPAYC